MINYYIFAFRSRNQSMRFYDDLCRVRVCARIVSTPRAASAGCGLSVRVNAADYNAARAVFARLHYDAFLGLFRSDSEGITRESI
jgi:hypothetical protein